MASGLYINTRSAVSQPQPFFKSVERALRGFAACSGGRAPKALAMLAAIWQIEIELYVSIKNFLSKTNPFIWDILDLTQLYSR
jgi:hypothetical protein